MIQFCGWRSALRLAHRCLKGTHGRVTRCWRLGGGTSLPAGAFVEHEHEAGFPIAVCSKQMPLPSCHSAGRVSRRHGYGFPVRGKRFLRNRLAFVRENVTDRQFCLFPVAAGKLTAKSAVHPPGGAGLDRATCDSLLPRRGCFARGTSREDQCLTSAGLVGAAH